VGDTDDVNMEYKHSHTILETGMKRLLFVVLGIGWMAIGFCFSACGQPEYLVLQPAVGCSGPCPYVVQVSQIHAFSSYNEGKQTDIMLKPTNGDTRYTSLKVDMTPSSVERRLKGWWF
jgi:hypothetical protein